MGQVSSVSNTLNKNYIITGSNNGLNTGNTDFGQQTQVPTLDVSPSTDLNYTTGVNPSWIGRLISTGKQLFNGISGTVGNNSDLIQTVKHFGSSLLRMLKDKPNESNNIVKTVNSFLSNSTPTGSLNSSEQVSTDFIKTIADYSIKIIEKLPQVNSMYQSLVLGSSPFRNNEVSSPYSNISLTADYMRGTDIEKQKSTLILETVGMRAGVVPNNQKELPPSLISETINNAITDRGRVKEIKKKGKEAEQIQRRAMLSLCHANSRDIISANVLNQSHYETNQFVGQITQNTPPFTATPYPNGITIANKDIVETVNVQNLLDGRMLNKFVLTPYAYNIPTLISQRDLRVSLTGQLNILDLPYDSSNKLYVGYIYKKDGSFKFQPGVLINPNVVLENQANIYTPYDSKNMSVKEISKIIQVDKKSTKTIPELLFSYFSQWQAVLNTDGIEQFKYSELISSTNVSHETMFILVTYIPDVQITIPISLSVQTPTLSVTLTRTPTSMTYIGSLFDGTILSLMGKVESWYATQDPYDPVNFYYILVKDFIPYLGKIAELHINSGAAYTMTSEIIAYCRIQSGLIELTFDQMKTEVSDLILNVGRYMYNDSPISKYSTEMITILFMRIVEMVIIQSMTHIDVYTVKYQTIKKDFLKDVDSYNRIMKVLDSNLIASSKNECIE